MAKSITDAVLDYKTQLELNIGESIYENTETIPEAEVEPLMIENVVI